MDWTTIDYAGSEIEAVDFLDGVLVKLIEGRKHPFDREAVFCPGYYVQEQKGDMDGPAIRPRKKFPPKFSLQWVQDE